MQAARLISVLRELNSSSPEIEASCVISTEGLVIASALPRGLDEDRVAAMSAALLARAERSARALQRGELEQFVLKGETGCIFMVYIGEGALLVVLTKPSAKYGLIVFDIAHKVQAVADELKQTRIAASQVVAA